MSKQCLEEPPFSPRQSEIRPSSWHKGGLVLRCRGEGHCELGCTLPFAYTLICIVNDFFKAFLLLRRTSCKTGKRDIVGSLLGQIRNIMSQLGEKRKTTTLKVFLDWGEKSSEWVMWELGSKTWDSRQGSTGAAQTYLTFPCSLWQGVLPCADGKGSSAELRRAERGSRVPRLSK